MTGGARLDATSVMSVTGCDEWGEWRARGGGEARVAGYRSLDLSFFSSPLSEKVRREAEELAEACTHSPRLVSDQRVGEHDGAGVIERAERALRKKQEFLEQARDGRG